MERTKYDFRAIEARWQQDWRERGLFRTRTDPERDYFYYLDMFPYPSGTLHMGHLRNYTIGDVVARYQTMRGKNVLHPMGWDAFGLPAENAAIKNRTHPDPWTQRCIAQMHVQFDMLGISFDWAREIDTSRPDYYTWTQWLFLQLHRAGLVTRSDALLNWCPSCATVLANEQVQNDGTCERCSAVVVKRQMEQWFFKITDYADRLLADLDALDRWPEPVKTMQRNWIGRSEGAEFTLPIAADDGTPRDEVPGLRVFTTRPDTSFGMTYAVMSPEHPRVDELVTPAQREAVAVFRASLAGASEIERLSTEGPAEKRGVFTGARVVNPFTGQAIPLYLADYVLMTYGTGAIMAVPGQDQRDWDFAAAHGLPIIRTVQPPEGWAGEAYTGDGLAINSQWLDGLQVAAAKAKAIDWLEAEGIGERKVNYRLRDWCISRQRYWGCPIPMLYCEQCGTVPVPEAELPVRLPLEMEFTGAGNPLAGNESFLRTSCPQCGGPARRETDTMDTFVDSSWYFLRFASQPSDRAFDADEVRRWLPVTQYVGGIEHATMHLIYARFFTKVLCDLGLLDFDEPFAALFTQGMVTKETWFAPAENAYYNDPEQLVGDPPRSPLGNLVVPQRAKMSKTVGNVVPPELICEKYGADTGRCYVLFVGPPDAEAAWQDDGVPGIHRWLNRVHRTFVAGAGAWLPDWRERLTDLDDEQQAVRRKLHQTIRKVGEDIERFALNTAVAALMELVNLVLPFSGRLSRGGLADRAVFSEAAEGFALILAPFAPHLADEIWQVTGHAGTTFEATWPSYEAAVAAAGEQVLAVQVNGKRRDEITVASDADRAAVEAAALASRRVQAHLEGATVRKVIVVPGRLVNIVAG